MAVTATKTAPAQASAGDDERRHIALAVLLIVCGVVGLIAAFNLTLDKFDVLENPHALGSLGCDRSVLVQCSKNLQSPEGSAFGFPNPVLGLMLFPAPILVGVSMLAGVRFPRWFLAVFNLGFVFAIGFVAFLITKSVFHLGTLCPWCMTVWSVVIPTSIAVTLANMRDGVLGRALVRPGRLLVTWTPLLTLIAYLVVAVVAQVRLDALQNL